MKSNVRYAVKRGIVDRDGYAAVEATITAGCRRWRCLVGIKCRPGDFATDRQAFRRGASVRRGKMAVPVTDANALLGVIRGRVLGLFATLTEWPPVETVRAAVDEAAGLAKRGHRAGSDGFDAWRDAFLADGRRGAKRMDEIAAAFTLMRMASEIGLAGLSPRDFQPERYEAYLRRIGGELTAARTGKPHDETLVRPWRAVSTRHWVRHNSDNAISQRVATAKQIFDWAVKTGRAERNPYRSGSYDMPKTKYGAPVYPTPEEVERLRSAKLTGVIAEARDLFILQSSIGCRVSDLRALTPEQIHDGRVEYVPRKTFSERAVAVSVPLSRRAAALLDGYAMAGVFLPSLMPEYLTTYTRRLREAFKAAGLDRMVETLDCHTGQPVTVPLWSLASSHMARRTFVGTLYNAGVKDSVIGSMSGHVPGSKAFARYYKVEDATKAAAVAVLDE